MANTFSYTGIILPALVPLDEMKRHLRVTDTDHDANITEITAAAQEAIIAYLGGASVDPAWTAATAPRWIVNQIKIVTAFQYEHRGDDEADTAKLWEAVGHNLGRHRDPSLA